MAPDEQESVAAQATPPPQEQEKKLGTLTKVESVVNEYARKFAKKHRVGEDRYTVVLVTQFKGIMGLKRGAVVQIILLWPDAQPNINTLLDSAFRTISRNRLVDGMALEAVFHIKRRAEDRKRMIREKIGVDEADIILDLIPKHRIRCTVTTTVKYEDVLTHECISVTHEAKPEQFRGQDVSNWLKLSRIVRDNHPEEATRYVDTIGDTSASEVALHDLGSDPDLAGTDVDVSEDVARSGSGEGDRGNDEQEHDARSSHQIAG